MAALRRSLRTYIGEDALNEIHSRPPAQEDDEASFMRLVNWTYVLLFEAGKDVIRYLTSLSREATGSASDLKAALTIVHDLRTWISHNIGFSSEREVAISTRVSKWFLIQCDKTEPRDAAAWGACFSRLCSEVGTIVKHCQDVLDSIVTDQREVDDFKRRIDRSWPTNRFDELASDICFRLEVTNLDVSKFRALHLDRWQEFLRTVPDEDDPKAAVIRIIERDVINYTSDILPIDGRDVMAALGLPPGPEVGAALLHARELHRSGIRDREQLLQGLREWQAALE